MECNKNCKGNIIGLKNNEFRLTLFSFELRNFRQYAICRMLNKAGMRQKLFGYDRNVDVKVKNIIIRAEENVPIIIQTNKNAIYLLK